MTQLFRISNQYMICDCSVPLKSTIKLVLMLFDISFKGQFIWFNDTLTYNAKRPQRRKNIPNLHLNLVKEPLM